VAEAPEIRLAGFPAWRRRQMFAWRVFRSGGGGKRSYVRFSGAAEEPYACLRFKSLIPAGRRSR
jgi:hypothetical protein